MFPLTLTITTTCENILRLLLLAMDSSTCDIRREAKLPTKEFVFCLETQDIYKFKDIMKIQGTTDSVPMSDTIIKRQDSEGKMAMPHFITKYLKKKQLCFLILLYRPHPRDSDYIGLGGVHISAFL